MMRFIKTIYRLFKYRAEWSKQIREIQIRKDQAQDITKLNSTTDRLIVFFIPGAEYQSGKEAISGGLISIVSLAEESRKLFSEDPSTEVVCCTYFGDHLLFKLTSFENSTSIFEYSQLPKYFKNVSSIILHVPELFVEDFCNNRFQELNYDPEIVQLNILNQNINLMPSDKVIKGLKKKVNGLTITTAHKKYCTPAFQTKYDVPLHLLSVWISPEKYIRYNFSEKKDLILFSPDNPSLTDQIIQLIQLKLPQFQTRVINGLSYEQYKDLIREAKFVITTGEGLDAYFIETYFSGGIGIAIKNEDFFDEKYLSLPALFNDFELVGEKLISKIEEINEPQTYFRLNNELVQLLTQDYSSENYRMNLHKFYFNKYTYPYN